MKGGDRSIALHGLREAGPLPSSSRLEDLGLKQFTVAELFTRIFIPTSFLLVCILHLHYFHDRFLELTDLKSIPSKEDSAIYR